MKLLTQSQLQFPSPAPTKLRALPSPIAFHRPALVGSELSYIAQAIQEGDLHGDGTFTARCHAWLVAELSGGSEAHAKPDVLLTTSCTTALEMAAMLLATSESPGEVIVPGYTFVSTANAFVVHGFRPVFVDVRIEDGNIDPKAVAGAITKSTRAIVPVHYAGVPCDMDALSALARPHGIAIVEDAAQALFSRYRGRRAATIGELGCFSFHGTKNISCGEGGALVINAGRHRERARVIREKGTNRARFLRGEVDKYTWVDRGGSYLPSELQSAYLLAQLERADRIQRRRATICARYRSGFAEMEAAGHLRISHPSPDVEPNHHIFWILVSGLEERTQLLAHLMRERIDARTHYVPLHLSPMGRQWGRGRGSLPVVERLADGLLRLPLHPSMTDTDADRVVDAVDAFFSRGARRPRLGGVSR